MDWQAKMMRVIAAGFAGLCVGVAVFGGPAAAYEAITGEVARGTIDGPTGSMWGTLVALSLAAALWEARR